MQSKERLSFTLWADGSDLLILQGTERRREKAAGAHSGGPRNTAPGKASLQHRGEQPQGIKEDNNFRSLVYIIISQQGASPSVKVKRYKAKAIFTEQPGLEPSQNSSGLGIIHCSGLALISGAGTGRGTSAAQRLSCSSLAWPLIDCY